jgi:hypothetical protein
LRQLSFSSAKKIAAAITPKIAVEAFRIAVRPVSMWSCPHAISEKGITLFRMPITRNAAQMRGSRGIGSRLKAM